MQDCAVSNVTIFLDHGVGSRESVHDTGILQVGAGFQNQAAEVAAQAGAGADIAVGADDDVANQHGTGMNVGSGINDRHNAVDGVNA